jgi:adenylylsulfate kinase-like enzyme
VKGLYAKAKSGDIKHFTGKDSSFEPPDNSSPANLELNTDEKSEEVCLEELHTFTKSILQ